MTETPTVLGLKRIIDDAVTDPWYEGKPVFILNEFGELHRIIGMHWSEDNDYFLLRAVTDE